MGVVWPVGVQLYLYGAVPPVADATADAVQDAKHWLPVPPFTTATITIIEIFTEAVAVHDLLSATVTV